jgi:hypothetical protein
VRYYNTVTMSKKPENKQYIHDDPEAVAEAKAKAKTLSMQSQEDTRALMALPAFRRFVWEILEQTHVFRTSFTGNSETFFKEGERNIGLKVFLRLQKDDPDGYAVMVKENSEGAKR